MILIDNQSVSVDINQFSSSNPAKSSLFDGLLQTKQSNQSIGHIRHTQ